MEESEPSEDWQDWTDAAPVPKVVDDSPEL
jgi:hypothetical protein